MIRVFRIVKLFIWSCCKQTKKLHIYFPISLHSSRLSASPFFSLMPDPPAGPSAQQEAQQEVPLPPRRSTRQRQAPRPPDENVSFARALHRVPSPLPVSPPSSTVDTTVPVVELHTLPPNTSVQSSPNEVEQPRTPPPSENGMPPNTNVDISSQVQGVPGQANTPEVPGRL